ncbi:MAG: DUF2497 domain-containing protein [Holosporales bacterium]|jgi:cell pole-organizing protein PopZ|nr:DUF2497 domain-containing protein [Holosporales bacterium]
MNNFEDKNEMSMEDILASIRKYVADDISDSNEQQSSTLVNSTEEKTPGEAIIKLNESQIINDKVSSETYPSFSGGKTTNNVLDMGSNDDNAVYNEAKVHESEANIANSEQEKSISKKGNPFNKLSSTLKEYGKPKNNNDQIEQKVASLTLDKFFSDIATHAIETWVKNNLESVAQEIIEREIRKIKNNN